MGTDSTTQSGLPPASDTETRPSVVIVDDAVEVRTLVRARLRMSGRVEVVGEGASGHEAIELADRLRPDLVLLDVSMPGMDGLEALPKVREVSPGTRVVMYSGFAEEGLADRTLQLGAAAFFEKSTALDVLADDLIRILEGAPAPTGPTATAEPEGPAAEPVLREHLERFREVFEDAAIGMATMTLSGRVVRANPSLGRLTGHAIGELVAASYADLAGADAGRLRDALAKVVTGSREVVQVEHRITGHDGDRYLLSTISSVRDVHQRPLYLFLQVQDVSAQREAEEELLLSEQRFRLLVEAVQDYAIFMLHPDGRIASWNAGAQRIKGWRAEEIVGEHFRTFYPADKQAERHPENELEIALREGRYEEEGWRVRKDGSTFWAQVTITAVHGPDGELVGFAKVTRDVTERMRMVREQESAAAALAEANTALEAVNAQLSQYAESQAHFLAVTAHELRTPVGVLAGAAQLLRQHGDELRGEERAELLESMSASADRLQRLLNDLLTASRVRESALEVHRREIDLRAALEAVVRNAARTGGAGAPDELRVDVPDGITVAADADRLAQMVENLLRNALVHGAPPISLTAERRGAEVDIVVRDAGSGVPEALHGRLFERFATSGDGGTGLGLYIVRALARAQGGDASYRDADRAFVITLPTSEDS